MEVSDNFRLAVSRGVCACSLLTGVALIAPAFIYYCYFVPPLSSVACSAKEKEEKKKGRKTKTTTSTKYEVCYRFPCQCSPAGEMKHPLASIDRSQVNAPTPKSFLSPPIRISLLRSSPRNQAREVGLGGFPLSRMLWLW